MTNIEHQFKKTFGYRPEPRLSDVDMCQMIRKAKEPQPVHQQETNGEIQQAPRFVILHVQPKPHSATLYACEQLTGVTIHYRDFEKPNDNTPSGEPSLRSFETVIGKRLPSGLWECIVYPDLIDEKILEDIAEQIQPYEWRDPSDFEGLSQHIVTYFDPAYKTHAEQVERLREHSVSNGTTQGDIFRQDDEAQ